MSLSQLQGAVIFLSGLSLFLHLFSARNFVSDSELGFFGTLMFYVHDLCNLVARGSLLVMTVVTVLESYRPGFVSSLIQVKQQILSNYLFKIIATAAVCMTIRLILPGPVASYSYTYILCVAFSCIAAVIAKIEVDSLVLTQQVQNEDITASSTPEATVSRQGSVGSDTYIPTKRHRTAMELLQTEKSYLRSLRTIMTVYKEPLDKAVAGGSPLLAVEDIRNVFGGVPGILEVHTLIHDDLSELIDDWKEDCCIADLITKYHKKLTEVYPPYVNYFDVGNEIISKQEKTNPVLKEFLTKCFHEPECLKQPLSALLIRPVQRLPSLLLLVSDLHKRTSEDLVDHTKLEDAKEALKQVLSHVNEDKRKTEGKMKIFDIVYEVTGCPVELVSSNRLFIDRVDVTTLSDELYRSGERLALYLLSDLLEVAKWRNRSHGNSLLKHVEMLSLSKITRILDMEDYGELTSIFALTYFVDENTSSTSKVDVNKSANEKTCVLQLLDDKTFKSKWLKLLAKQIGIVQDRAEFGQLIQKVDASEMMNFVKRGTKQYKKFLRLKSKTD